MKKTLLILLFLTLWSASALAKTRGSAVIIAYNRIGEDEYPDESLRLEQFQSQIEALTGGDYTILPVRAILAKIKNGTPLPDKTVGITFDGAYRSAYEHATPLLIEKEIPFTVFFSSDLASDNTSQHMSWQELKSLSRHSFVDLGLHPSLYARLSDFSDLENRKHLNKALSAAREQIGFQPKLFAFPFGEYDAGQIDLVKDYKFEAVFGLHSGAFNTMSEGEILPRFAMTERYGNPERFRLVTTALPFPHYDLEPTPPVFDTDRPVMGFSVPDEQAAILEKTSCFISGQGRAKIMRIGDNRIEIRSPYAVDENRIRINCTAPAKKEKEYEETRWHWLGLLLHRKEQPASSEN